MSDRYSRFEEAAAELGLVARDLGNGHWQARGPLTISYLPFADGGPVLVVNDERRPVKQGGVREALKRALHSPQVAPRKMRNRRNMRNTYRAKKYMLKMNPHCRWCGCVLSLENATVDHLIPISRGGADHKDNIVLACLPCNQARSNRMPHRGMP